MRQEPPAALSREVTSAGLVLKGHSRRCAQNRMKGTRAEAGRPGGQLSQQLRRERAGLDQGQQWEWRDGVDAVLFENRAERFAEGYGLKPAFGPTTAA